VVPYLEACAVAFWAVTVDDLICEVVSAGVATDTEAAAFEYITISRRVLVAEQLLAYDLSPQSPVSGIE
jgi:hypothetical protein